VKLATIAQDAAAAPRSRHSPGVVSARRPAPRIYAAPLVQVTTGTHAAQLLDRLAELGFDTVLAIGSWTADAAWLVPLVAETRRRGLHLFLDLSLNDDVASDVVENLDPRHVRVSPRRRGPAPRRDDVRQAVELGVAGFRCNGLRPSQSSLWRAIIQEDAPSATFCAWTPGLGADEVDQLAETGFHLSFASTPWWDLRAPWLVEEYRRRRLTLPPIGMVEEPGGRRFAAGLQGSAEQRRRAMSRQLWAAAVTGHGYILPAGFEFGAREPLDPEDAQLPDWSRTGFDLGNEIAALNAFIVGESALQHPGDLRQSTAAGSPITAVLRSEYNDLRTASRAVLVLINATGRNATIVADALLPEFAGSAAACRRHGIMCEPLTPGMAIALAPREVTVYVADGTAAPSIPYREPSAGMLAAAPRVVIERVSPDLGESKLVIKRLAGQMMLVEADIFSDGHDVLRAALLWRRAGDRAWQESAMTAFDNDRWRGGFPLAEAGRYEYTVTAWRDLFATWRDEVNKKHAAGQPIALELREGRALLERAAARLRGEDARILRDTAASAADLEPDAALCLLLDEAVRVVMARNAERMQASRHRDTLTVMADRREALFASWYELFPRSQSGDPDRHGTFDDVIRQLPGIRRMGFDVLYFPPIHPIGRTNRKGRNNALQAAAGDPGSPYAIGATDGGHDAVHAELGGIEALRRLVAAAADYGIEIALDFAIQCSPDHPWLRQHPGWFAWRADGSLRYAENPPKKYEDIVNVDFYAADAVPGLWHALRDVVLFWINEGVRIFRVDNPHTKPLPFWAWLIESVQCRHPDALFLAEAFTRPKMMQRLGKIGFSQSYTYFTWRNTKAELTAYLTELAQTEMRDYYRPNFFVNTPDINPVFLQTSGRPGFLIRAALAATLSGLWGVYCGFEVCEGRAIPGKEEYLDSEKYQIRVWDRSMPGNIVAEITRLNRIRRENPALQTHLGIAFLNCGNDQVLCYRKMTSSGDNMVLVLVSLDPHGPQDATFEVPLWEFGLPDHGAVAAEDLMHDTRGTWTGKLQQHRLDPSYLPFAIWRISRMET